MNKKILAADPPWLCTKFCGYDHELLDRLYVSLDSCTSLVVAMDNDFLRVTLVFCMRLGHKEEQKDDKNLGKVSPIDVMLRSLRVQLGPELRMVYPLILNFAVSGELELNGFADPLRIKPKGTLTFENGDVNLVATQVLFRVILSYLVDQVLLPGSYLRFRQMFRAPRSLFY